MSIAAMNWVWEHSPHKGSALLLLLAIADNARDEDWAAWPGVATLRRKTRLSERNVQYILRTLEASGAITIDHAASPYGTNIYRVVGGANFAPVLSDRGANQRRGGVQTSVKPVRQVAPKPPEETKEETREIAPTILRIRERDAKRLSGKR